MRRSSRRLNQLFAISLSIAIGGWGVWCQSANSTGSREQAAGSRQQRSREAEEQRSRGEGEDNFACPQDLPILMPRMLKDLPSYANRVIQRSRSVAKTPYRPTYVLAAGKPEFEPLQSKSNQYTPKFSETSQQVYFTTLERRYVGDRAIDTQNYHRLILTPGDRGWEIVLMFSQFGSTAADRPPSPPQDTTNGYIGQAVSLWLRDCQNEKGIRD